MSHWHLVTSSSYGWHRSCSQPEDPPRTSHLLVPTPLRLWLYKFYTDMQHCFFKKKTGSYYVVQALPNAGITECTTTPGLMLSNRKQNLK
jgi:hypothetical protein